jgi:RNA polymerase sigma factor (sigma-70 family)
MVEFTDEALMEQFCAGNTRAFDSLFGRHDAAIRGYLQKLTGSAAVAEDLAQVTFLSLVRARGRFLKGAKLKPWLYAIATNAARDWRRHARFESVTDDGVTPDTETAETPLDDTTLQSRALQKRVRDALEKLPAAQREAIVLNRFEGFGFAEIAEVTGVSESAAKVRAHRGYERLRELLKGVDVDAP